jgi:hypothetical protein
MRAGALLLAFIAFWFGTAPLRADEPTFDGLPLPALPWLSEPASMPLVIQPRTDFNDMLRNRSTSATIDASSDLPFYSGRMKLTREATLLDSVQWLSNMESPDARELRDLPALSRDWKSEHSLKLPLPIEDSLFMFGKLDSAGDIDHSQNKLKTRTGFGWKWSPFAGSELQVRTGSLTTYEDDSMTMTRPTERAQLSFELEAKLVLFGPLQLQYVSEALPALVQADRNTLLHDLKLALPLGTNQEVSLGAKYRWDDSLAPTPWTQRTELYMGLKFER